jgi:hypothetical protein
MEYMFYNAWAFNQRLCAWKDKFPYGTADNIFVLSGCPNKSTPTSDQDAFCAGSADDCQQYTHPPTKSPTASPTTFASHCTCVMTTNGFHPSPCKIISCQDENRLCDGSYNYPLISGLSTGK